MPKQVPDLKFEANWMAGKVRAALMAEQFNSLTVAQVLAIEDIVETEVLKSLEDVSRAIHQEINKA